MKLLIIVLILASSVRAEYRPRTWLFTSKHYSLVIGKKNCGPHKARMFFRKVLTGEYGKGARRVEKRFNLSVVEGL